MLLDTLFIPKSVSQDNLDSDINSDLFVHVLPNVQTHFVSDFNVANVKAVDQVLHRLRVAAGRCSEGENTEMRILGHE
jgi:hypothetical protein